MSQETTSELGGQRAMQRGMPTGRVYKGARTQREVLLNVLRIAAQYETWVTLAELAEKTKFPPASISAQLRHLRKEKYGAWKVERRKRAWVTEELVWEYRLGV